MYKTDIGLECAGFLNGFGYNTTIMVRSVVLRGFDQQMANIVAEEMKNQGVQFIYQAKPKAIEKQNGQFLVLWEDKVISINLKLHNLIKLQI